MSKERIDIFWVYLDMDHQIFEDLREIVGGDCYVAFLL